MLRNILAAIVGYLAVAAVLPFKRSEPATWSARSSPALARWARCDSTSSSLTTDPRGRRTRDGDRPEQARGCEPSLGSRQPVHFPDPRQALPATPAASSTNCLTRPRSGIMPKRRPNSPATSRTGTTRIGNTPRPDTGYQSTPRRATAKLLDSPNTNRPRRRGNFTPPRLTLCPHTQP